MIFIPLMTTVMLDHETNFYMKCKPGYELKYLLEALPMVGTFHYMVDGDRRSMVWYDIEEFGTIPVYAVFLEFIIHGIFYVIAYYFTFHRIMFRNSACNRFL